MAVGTLPVVPPEHVHEAHDEEHHHAIIHRHWQPHRLVARSFNLVARGFSRASVTEGFTRASEPSRPSAVEDNDDDPILTIAVVYTVTAPESLMRPPQVIVNALDPPVIEPSDWGTDEVDLLIHGPPRAAIGLRAPPFTLLL
jgi:hypothetical protein